MSLANNGSLDPEPSLPEERRVHHLPPKSYAAAAAAVESGTQDYEAEEVDGYEEDNGSLASERHLSNGKKSKRSEKMTVQDGWTEREQLVEERYRNGDGLTSFRKGRDYNESLQLDEAERKSEKKKDSPSLTSGRTAGAGWGRSKSVVAFPPLLPPPPLTLRPFPESASPP